MDALTLGFLALSLISGFVELGAVLLVIRDAQPSYYIPLMGLAYQLGALLREPVELAAWQYCLALVLSTVIGIFAYHSPVLLFLTVLLLSIGLQGARAMISEGRKLSTSVKRVSRVVGFACSGFLFVQLLPIVSAVVLLLVLLLVRDLGASQRASIRKGLKPGPLGWIMAIHQSHYFSYAYVVPFLFIHSYGVEPEIAGLLFCIGWLSYISARKVFGDRTLVRNFTVGHILAAATLVGMFFFYGTTYIASLVLWFLTGFGGGTVYCLRDLRARSTTDKSELDSWENIGHVLGVLVCLAVFVLLDAPRWAFVAASLIAVSTCLLFLMTQQKHSSVLGGS